METIQQLELAKQVIESKLVCAKLIQAKEFDKVDIPLGPNREFMTAIKLCERATSDFSVVDIFIYAQCRVSCISINTELMVITDNRTIDLLDWEAYYINNEN